MLMRSRVALTWVQVFALTVPGFPTPVRAQQPPLARFIHRTTLDNGLDIVVAENHAVPLATVLVAVRNRAFTPGACRAGARAPVRARPVPHGDEHGRERDGV